MTVYLHHYPPSLFSEKIRALLGYYGMTWHSVIIPSIMPRPLLMPLSGGYRKTPVLQMDANVFCDTQVIARALARLNEDPDLYAAGFNGDRLAEWADTQLFRVTVALNFSPDAIAAMMQSLPAAEVEAFQKDRAELSRGASITSFSPEAAKGYLRHYLAQLERQLEDNVGFLFGSRPTIADFSVYHCLWFLRNNAVNAALLDPYPAIAGWYDRMAAFGHGDVVGSTGEAALARALETEPLLPKLTSDWPPGFAAGQPVAVTPVDYGLIPVQGELKAWTADEIVIARASLETGDLFCHFPSPGFEVRAA